MSYQMPFAKGGTPRAQRSIEEQMHPQPATLKEIGAPERTERFEVVLLDRKKTLGDALPADFKRVAITAASPNEARANKLILDLSDKWIVVGCVTGHVLTEEEKAAQRLAQRQAMHTTQAAALPQIKR